MPLHNVEFERLPAGIAVSSVRKGENVTVQYRGVATSEDGELLIRYLGFASDFLDLLASKGAPIRPSQVDNLAAVIRKDRSATVFVNELNLISSVRVFLTVRAGEPILKDDIVDILEARFDGVEVPADAGVVLVYSVEWRKGLLFDFGPLDDRPDNSREYDVWKEFGKVLGDCSFRRDLQLIMTIGLQCSRCVGFHLSALVPNISIV